MATFEEFGLIEPLLRALKFEGYSHPTGIQEQAIPILLSGHDLLGCAQTGTGKTAAFALPILQRLAETVAAAPAHDAQHGHSHAGHAHQTQHEHGDQPAHEQHAHGGHSRGHHGGEKSSHGHGQHGGRGHQHNMSHRHIRALVLSPTRELTSQISDSFRAYGRHLHVRQTSIYGGVKQGAQVQALRRGVDVLIATPGRLMDLMEQGYVRLDKIEIFVLDEADRMLDMGFIADIRKIVAMLPAKRQTLLFSATMPPEIHRLAQSILHEAKEVRIAPHAPAAETVSQKVFFVEKPNKQALLEHLLSDPSVTRALVFIRTKRGADRVANRLRGKGIQADAIHSDRTQGQRERALKSFRDGQVRVLVASDIAARGLDVDEISHVINFDMPDQAETYVHRIGRTGRAGESGLAMSFCDIEERTNLDDIEKMLKRELDHVDDHPFPSPLPRKPLHERQKPKHSGMGMNKRPVRRNPFRR